MALGPFFELAFETHVFLSKEILNTVFWTKIFNGIERMGVKTDNPSFQAETAAE